MRAIPKAIHPPEGIISAAALQRYWSVRKLRAALSALMEESFREMRVLPRVVPQPAELPAFDERWIESQAHQGWLGEGLWLAVHNERLVSFVDIRIHGQQAALGYFATHPAHRRLGYASACLNAALQHARACGATQIYTAFFIDSRLKAACRFLEQQGFSVRNPERQNIVMQIDMDRYQPQEIFLPAGFALESLQLEWLPQWMDVKNRVFETNDSVEWFAHFSQRWDFDPAGWLTLWHYDKERAPLAKSPAPAIKPQARLVGIAAADFHRDPATPTRICGCQIEYVGVLPEYRGLGLGECLMRACLNYVHQHHVKPCQLITQPFRKAAIGLYEKLGFRVVRENRIYEKCL